MNHYLYIVFSATPYRMGKMIRLVTRESYNHVSISLDADLSQMYSFGRRFYHAPFYGGFVKESPARYYLGTQQAHIQICKLPVTQEQYETISQLLWQMHRDADTYLYNHLSALTAVFHIPWNLYKAYTCVEFCVELLSKLDLPVNRRQFYSVDSLRLLLQEYVIYTGPMNRSGTDGAFFEKLPFWHVLKHSLGTFIGLVPRIKRT